jgi:RES domain-containing protein
VPSTGSRSSRTRPDEPVRVAFRIGSLRYPLLDGAGAAASDDARWNSRGRFIVYAAEHYATALVEKMAQLGAQHLPSTLAYTRIELPEDVTIERIQPAQVPHWDAEDRSASQAFGDAWYDQRRSLALLVPSLAAPGLEWNVLINQKHPDFTRVTASKPRPIVCHPKLMA